MIKVDKNEICFEGIFPTIATEVVVALKYFKEMCVKNLGEKAGNEFYSNVIKVVDMSSAELKEEGKRLDEEVWRKIIGHGE